MVALRDRGLPAAVCTIYNPCSPDEALQREANQMRRELEAELDQLRHSLRAEIVPYRGGDIVPAKDVQGFRIPVQHRRGDGRASA